MEEGSQASAVTGQEGSGPAWRIWEEPLRASWVDDVRLPLAV